jgi:hypothetical protein
VVLCNIVADFTGAITVTVHLTEDHIGPMDKYNFPGDRPVYFTPKVQPDQSLNSLRNNLVNTAGANLNGLSFTRITSRSETPFGDLEG